MNSQRLNQPASSVLCRVFYSTDRQPGNPTLHRNNEAVPCEIHRPSEKRRRSSRAQQPPAVRVAHFSQQRSRSVSEHRTKHSYSEQVIAAVRAPLQATGRCSNTVRHPGSDSDHEQGCRSVRERQADTEAYEGCVQIPETTFDVDDSSRTS